jgi:hypothetical protein
MSFERKAKTHLAMTPSTLTPLPALLLLHARPERRWRSWSTATAVTITIPSTTS